MLNVLTNGSTGRNPTFFKAFGHNDVFGLKVDLPSGSKTMEIAEKVSQEDDNEMEVEENVLYVQLPEGHPVILEASAASEASPSTTDDSEKTPNEPPEMETALQHSLSLEEAIEQADIVFDDLLVDSTLPSVKEFGLEGAKEDDESGLDKNGTGSQKSLSVCDPIQVDVSPQVDTNTSSSSTKTASPGKTRTSPRISPRIAQLQHQQEQKALQQQQRQKVETQQSQVDESERKAKMPDTGEKRSSVVSSKSKESVVSIRKPNATATTNSRHNLRPKRTLRHVQALKQQAKRRKRNTNVASGASPSVQRTLSTTRRSSVASNGGKDTLSFVDL